MRTSDFDYVLPPELIAQTPTEPRDHSRLLVLERDTGTVRHRARFAELVEELHPGDLLVMNDSRVIPARLLGVRAGTRGKVEVLLVRRVSSGRWVCLGRPGRRVLPGARLVLSRNGVTVEAEVESVDGDGLRTVSFSDEGALARVGHAPLPPYIHTPLADPDRYQTVYARAPGSAAAPTAGLHFTPGLLQRLHDSGVQTATVTLHVGLDTFRPVEADDPARHHIHTEHWKLNAQTAEALNVARSEGRRVIAVGTTSVRTLEQAARLAEEEAGPGRPWGFAANSGWADLFILPGYRFRAVDALITNFHLPRSTLLMLVSAFAGRERVLHAYQEAIDRSYRFYSFGDAMFIP